MTSGEQSVPKEDEPIETAVHMDSTAVHVDGASGKVDGSLTLKDAAAFYGVSERTLRRRIKDGTVPAFKQQTAQGYEWRVRVDGGPGHVDILSSRQRGHLDRTPGQTAPPELGKALDLVDRLQRENQQLAGQVGFLQARVQDQERQIALLSAPKDDAPSAAAPPPAEAPRRPWWRQIFNR